MSDTCSVPPAPGRLPGLGHIPHLLRQWRDPMRYLASLGNADDLLRLDIPFMRPVVIVARPELVHEVMVAQGASFEKGRLYDRVRPFVGDGLATADRTTHRRHRRLMQPSFHRERLAEYGDVMSRLAVERAESWQPGRLIDLHQETCDWAVDTLAATLFAADIGHRANEVVRQDVPIVLRTMLVRALLPPVLDRLPIPANRQFTAASTRLREVIDEVIAAERARPDDGGANSLLGLLLAARDADSGEALSDGEVKDELATILFAGTDTVGSILAWASWEVSQHPEVEKRLATEIRTVLGDRAPAFEDIARLPYTRQVIEETLRLHSPTFLERRTLVEVKLGGCVIPAGTEVAFSPYGLHRHPGVWQEPDAFDPDRWLPDRRAELPREAVLLFGAGSRKCIGDGFALAEMTIGLATVLARWRFSPEPGFRPQTAIAAMPHPISLPMRVEPRSS